VISLRETLIAPLRAARDDMRAFREAYREAPEPTIGWDVLGARAMFRKGMPLLLKEHSSPTRMAAAVWLGTFVGCSPLYGLHYFIVIFLAVFLRLNKVVTWLATNVSFPAFAPFVAFASIQAGSFATTGAFMDLHPRVFLTEDLGELARRFFFLWLVGGLFVGAALGVVLGGGTYLILRRLDRSGESDDNLQSRG
jgi:uncharacterized protein (DUF2062 family)